MRSPKAKFRDRTHKKTKINYRKDTIESTNNLHIIMYGIKLLVKHN